MYIWFEITILTHHSHHHVTPATPNLYAQVIFQGAGRIPRPVQSFANLTNGKDKKKNEELGLDSEAGDVWGARGYVCLRVNCARVYLYSPDMFLNVEYYI